MAEDPAFLLYAIRYQLYAASPSAAARGGAVPVVRDRRGEGDGADLQPADAVQRQILDLSESQLGDQVAGRRMSHENPAVHIVWTRDPGRELEARRRVPFEGLGRDEGAGEIVFQHGTQSGSAL